MEEKKSGRLVSEEAYSRSSRSLVGVAVVWSRWKEGLELGIRREASYGPCLTGR